MRALIRSKPGFVDFEVRERPVIRDEYEVLVETHFVGICGGDLTYFRGTGHTSHVKQAYVVGHEVVGTVTEGPLDLVGKKVLIDPLLTCGQCSFCLDSLPQLCPNRRDMGYGADGVAAEFVKVPRKQIYEVSDELSSSAGVLVHGLAAVLHSLSRATKSRLPKTAKIFGPGPAGLMFALRLQELGVDVALVGRDSWRLDLAQSLRIKTIEIEEEKKNVTHSELTIDTTGASGVLELALDRIEPGGTFLLYAPGNFNRDATKVFRRELNIVGSTGAPNTMASAIKVLEKNLSTYQQLLTHSFPISKGQAAFELATSPPENRGNFLKAWLCLD